MSKGHTAACTQRVNATGKMLGVAGDTRLRGCRRVSAAAWAPSSSAGESYSQSRSGATLSASCPAPHPPTLVQATHCPVHCCGFVGVSYPPLIPRASQKASPEQAIQLQE